MCDGADNDCDGTTDRGAADVVEYYADQDGDGAGDPWSSCGMSCTPLDGCVEDREDCADDDPARYPGAADACDDVDQDCDGDDGCPDDDEEGVDEGEDPAPEEDGGCSTRGPAGWGAVLAAMALARRHRQRGSEASPG